MKKKLLIAAVSVLSVMILLIGFITLITNKGYGISQGRYLEAKNGYPMLILGNSPIQLSDRKEKIFFEKFNIGDEILVIHDGIEESYPGKTSVHAVYKLRDGTSDDIPQDVISSLVELGWLESELKLTVEKTTESESYVTTCRMNCW